MIIANVKLLIELFACLYCMAALYDKKLQLNIYAVVLYIVDMFFGVAIDNNALPVYSSALFYICIFLYALLCYRESIMRTLINCVLSILIVAIFQLIVFFPLYYLYFVKYQHSDINELMINIGTFLLIMFISHKIRLKRLSDFCIKRNRLIVGVAIFILLGIAGSTFRVTDVGILFSDIYIQMIYFLLIFVFIIYEWQKSRVDAEKKKTQLEMNTLYYDAYDQLIMLIRERQHDMKNHINAILSMIYTTNNYDELVSKQTEYCNNVMDRNEKSKLVLSVENPLIAGFLYSKIQEAEEKEIKFDYHIDIGKSLSVIPEYELIDMAGILIDNAIEALCPVDKSLDKEKLLMKIYVSIKEAENELELIVANTSPYFEDNVTDYFFETGYSSKGDGRGIGLSKLKRIVDEKSGDIIVSNEEYENNNYIQFTIIIPIKSNTKRDNTRL
ncbi:MAG: GHKL domain-containing protein [Lachnospiraceae bacterium]|nr:GHKL domain-containing protein [Lachnospiraceae bacterium]